MNKPPLPFELLEAPEVLASCHGWSEEVYRDLMALQDGSLSPKSSTASTCIGRRS